MPEDRDLFTEHVPAAHRLPPACSALPLGARLVLDPWTGKLALLRSATSFQVSTVREKVPLMVTPLTPYVKYVEGGATAKPAAAPGKKSGKK